MKLMVLSKTPLIINVQDLQTYFYTPEGVARAVDGISYQIGHGEVVGLVGESGCGKSVSALSILRLIQSPPGEIVGGRIDFEGRNLLDIGKKEMEGIRGNRISMIFQEPMSCLNPIFSIGNQISESIRVHSNISKRDALIISTEMLNMVGIPSPKKRLNEYPHHMSGGMRQRVMIAMALACKPGLLIADEPTTALDVTIQAQILELMLKLCGELSMAILFITHDLGVVAQTTERVIVMYCGQIVEVADVRELFKKPIHPYTSGLLESVPKVEKMARKRNRRSRLKEISGVVPGLTDLPKGCRFQPRCRLANPICENEEPELLEVTPDHFCRCWLHY